MFCASKRLIAVNNIVKGKQQGMQGPFKACVACLEVTNPFFGVFVEINML